MVSLTKKELKMANYMNEDSVKDFETIIFYGVADVRENIEWVFYKSKEEAIKERPTCRVYEFKPRYLGKFITEQVINKLPDDWE